MKALTAFFALFFFVLVCAAFWPRVDMEASGFFYQAGHGFYLAAYPFFLFLHWLACYGARALGVALGLITLITALRHKPMFGIGPKGWLFLFLGILIAPVLIGNVMLKDHWGRARPREIVDFGGHQAYSPALEPRPVLHPNGSFVAGDPAFGFYLPAFAYLVPRRPERRKAEKYPDKKWRNKNLSRKIFWAGMTAGCLFGLARLAMGAHFISDILFAACFMLAAVAALHALMYGRRETAAYWRLWF